MRADVINRFIDAETGEPYLPGSEVDLPVERIERLERAKAVLRKAEPPPPQPQPVAEQPERPKRRGRGRPRKGE